MAACNKTLWIQERYKSLLGMGVFGKGMCDDEDHQATRRTKSDPPMRPSTFCILVLIALYLLVMHSIHQEEHRIADRRRQDLPHPEERRIQQQRKGRTTLAFLKWAARSIWS